MQNTSGIGDWLQGMAVVNIKVHDESTAQLNLTIAAEVTDKYSTDTLHKTPYLMHIYRAP